MKVALYARVSSQQQAENDLSIASQLKALRKYAKRKEWTVYKEYVDEAESARSANRPAFQEMIGTAKKKNPPFEIILLWKFSRFARNREDSIIYKSLLLKNGVSVISMNEQVDDTPSGKLLEGIIEVIDEFYSLNLAVDTIRGLRENATRGFKNGSLPFGYKAKKVMDGNNQRTKLEPDENHDHIIKQIFKMALENKGIKEIAKTLNNNGLKTGKGNHWSNSAVSYILKNEAYAGTQVFGKTSKNKLKLNNPEDIIRIEDNHTPIIEKDDFNAVQKLMSNRRSQIIHPRRVASQYLLSGLVFCGKCGAAMSGCSAKSGKFFYYACQNYLKRGKDVCDMKLTNKNKIEKLVIDSIKTNILTEKTLSGLFKIVIDEYGQSKKGSLEQLKSIDKQLGTFRGRLGKLYNSLETGKLDIDDLAPRIKELKSQMNILEKKRIEVEEETSSPSSIPFKMSMLKHYVEDLTTLLKKGTIVEQKSFLHSFIKRIVVNHPEVQIDYNIPIINKKGRTSETEVLPIVKNGSSGRIRTYNLMINSHPLYH
jgi:site-specific DNA recombinase